MRMPYDDAEAFDFADSLAVRRIMQEQKREEVRLAKRRSGRHISHYKPDDEFDEDEIAGSLDGFDDFDDFEDYDEDEFDSYSR